MERTSHIHPFAPVWTPDSTVLILGTFPSVRSRKEGFYYMHPQNRFWKVMARLYQEEPGLSIHEKTDFLHRHGIALWDSIQSCTVCGSSDASLRDVIPNDLTALLRQTKIRRVFCNGTGSYRVYTRYQQPATLIPSVLLPSTSAANASRSLDSLCEAWRAVL